MQHVAGNVYTDPCIHTVDNQGFGKGNQGFPAIQTFLRHHRCPPPPPPPPPLCERVLTHTVCVCVYIHIRCVCVYIHIRCACVYIHIV
jgi:hypothetical protein